MHQWIGLTGMIENLHIDNCCANKNNSLISMKKNSTKICRCKEKLSLSFFIACHMLDRLLEISVMFKNVSFKYFFH